jgi:ribonuclease-3
VEGRRADAGDLRQPRLPRPAPAAPRLPDLRPVRSARQAHPGARGPIGAILTSERAEQTPAVDDHTLPEQLGVHIEPDLLELALTHRSYAYENGGLPTNERLEFLGDSVLGIVVTDALYRQFPELPEGRLAKLRAAVVNMRALAEVAGGLGVGDHLRLGKGEEATGGRGKASILADTMEALIGATYLTGGIEAATGLVRRLIDPLVQRAVTQGAGLDWKTSLQELTSREELGVPEYRIVDSGPDHAKTFDATVLVAGEPVGRGRGASKKEAEQIAARHAWTDLNERASADGISAG